MTTIQYNAPTGIFCSDNCLERNSHVIAAMGKRAFIITGHFSDGCRNLALEDTEALFDKLHIEYTVYADTEENPSVESIVRVTDEIRRYQPDFIFAIGGGSALDSAKAANVLINFPADADAYHVFYGGKDNPIICDSGKYPMLAIPTTAGSGSDVMGFAILTRTDTHTKLRINQLSYFNASFLDARYIAESPQWLLDTGAADALAHGIEGALNVKCTPLCTFWIHYGFSLFADFKDALIEKRLQYDDYANMLLAACVQGNGNLQSSTTIPHGLGYSLTHFKGVTHGIASLMFIPSFLRMFKDQKPVEEIIHRCGFADLDEFDQFVRTLVHRNVDIKVSLKEIDDWAKECSSLKPRLEACTEQFTLEDIKTILLETLRDYII